MALVFSVAINDQIICPVALVNTGSKNDQGEYRYRFQVPLELNDKEIFHDREKPWYELIEKAIVILKEAEGTVLKHGSYTNIISLYETLAKKSENQE